MAAEAIGTVLTLSVFGSLGWFLARWFSLPVRFPIWALLVVAVIGGGYVGVHTWLVSVDGVGIRLNVVIASTAAGTLIALLVRTGQHRRRSAGAT